MARKKNKKKKGKRGQALSGTAQGAPNPYLVTLKDGVLMLITAIAAGGAGAVFGRHSLIAGLPVTFIGIHKQNKYIIAAGLGLTLSNGFQKKGQAVTTEGTEGIGALDFKQIAEQAKDRVSTFFKTFSEKLYLPKGSAETTGGLGEDQVTYFVNPYSTKELDMSEIDRIQEQIAEMNRSGASGLDEIEREY